MMSSIFEDDCFIELIWKIENFSCNLYEPGEYFSTGEIQLFLAAPWYLQLYPKGTSPSSSEWISVMLRRGHSQYPNSISMKTEFCLLDANGEPRFSKQCENQFTLGTQRGIENLVKAEEDVFSNEDMFLPKDCFTLRCRFSSEGKLPTQNILVCTKIDAMRRTLLLTIENFKIGASSSIILKHFPYTFHDLTVKYEKDKVMEWIIFKLKRDSMPDNPFVLQSRMSVFDDQVLYTYVLNKKCLDEENMNWKVKPLLTQDKLLQMNTTTNESLKVTCDFLLIKNFLNPTVQYQEQFKRKKVIKDEDDDCRLSKKRSQTKVQRKE